jgi:hypothetical protein
MAGPTKTIIGLGGLEGLEQAEKAAKEAAEKAAKKEAERARQAREGNAAPAEGATPRPERVAAYSGPTVVDDDKVAEGLKKLRSLDDSLGPLTGVTQAVTDASSSEKTRVAEPGERVTRSGTLGGSTILPSNQATLPGLPAAPPIGAPVNPPPGPPPGNPLAKALGGLPSSFTTRPTEIPGLESSRGVPQPVGRESSDAMASLDMSQPSGPRLPRPTALGRSASAPAGEDPLVPIPGDDRAYKGTLHGHDIHLPDLPEVLRDDSSGATVLADPSPITAGQMHAAIPEADFSLNNRGFFESDAIDDDEDEAPRKRSSLPLRIGVFVAVVTAFVVAAVAWVRVHKPEVTEVKPPPPAAPAPSAATETAPANPVPSPAETPLGAAPAAAETPPAPARPEIEVMPKPSAPAVEAPAVVDRPGRVKRTSHLEKPSHAAGKTSEHYSAGTRRPSGTVEAAPRTSRPAGTPAPSSKTGRGKRPGQEDDDPDGTLPLSPTE